MRSAARKHKIDLKKPYKYLPQKQRNLIFKGASDFYGIDEFFAELEKKRYKLHIRVFLSRYRGQFICPSCSGARLKSEALNVRINNLNIHQLSQMTIDKLADWFNAVNLTTFESSISQDILRQIKMKLQFLLEVGLHYLTLERTTRTLSAGEAQRINLANQLGSRLVGTLYVLDEPSIGICMIDQHPIGKSPRSNPITYMKVFDEVRKFFATLPQAKSMGLTASSFSFNLPGGRCETCQGLGRQRLEMYLFEDVFVTCEQCGGKRYKTEVLEVTYKGRNIHHILELTVDEAWNLFSSLPGLRKKLELLKKVGLGYLRLGQSATALSGGEAQRLKICRELSQPSRYDYLYLLDEPTTGLHFDDIKKLVTVLENLIDAGNTVVVVEHNLDLIKMADYIIDLGPEGGERGGQVIAQGTPEEIVKKKRSYTGRFLIDYLTPQSPKQLYLSNRA